MNPILKWIGFIVASPFLLLNSFFDPEGPPIYAAFAHEITEKTLKELTGRHQMYCSGITEGMLDSVYIMGLNFHLDRLLEKEEARKIIVDCVETYLLEINQNEKIRPYLKNFPFTEKNLEMRIFSDYPDGKTVYFPWIGAVSSVNGNVNFYTNDPDNYYEYKTEETEPYQEALRIVREGKPTP